MRCRLNERLHARAERVNSHQESAAKADTD